MKKLIRVSGKNLGSLSLKNTCGRCSWFQVKLGFKFPFSVFPGIFSSIDSYTKRIVHSYFDEHGRPPSWLDDIPDLVSYVEPPHWSKFNLTDEKHGVLLTGMPDGVFVRRSRSFVIVDYKTARFTAVQDELYPMYETQLNVYALIAVHCGLSPVTGLALIYMEPITDLPNGYMGQVADAGFGLQFSAHVLDVPLQPGLIPDLLARVRKIAGMRKPPAGAENCKNCALIEAMLRCAGGQ